MEYKNVLSSEDYLIQEGFGLSFKGFEYLVYILNNYKSIRNNKITDIYNEIANKYNTTNKRVERNIRFILNKYNSGCNKKVIAYLIYDFNKKKESNF